MSLGEGEGVGRGFCLSVCPSALVAAGVVWVSPPSPRVLPSLGRGRCLQGGVSTPPASLPSPQCGEGTPQVTGFFEVFVAGKLVHSKKVCLSILPHWGPLGGWDWDWPTPLLVLPSPGRRWLRGHGEQVSEAGGRHQSCFGSGLMCPEGNGEGAPARGHRPDPWFPMHSKPKD